MSTHVFTFLVKACAQIFLFSYLCTYPAHVRNTRLIAKHHAHAPLAPTLFRATTFALACAHVCYAVRIFFFEVLSYAIKFSIKQKADVIFTHVQTVRSCSRGTTVGAH